MITIIAAVAKNRVIGKNNKLIWHLPADLRFFKTTTMGHALIMGRKTFESFEKPLPGRKMIVISRQHDYFAPGATIVHSLPDALSLIPANLEAFITGGAEIYKLALPIANRMMLTKVEADFEGDTIFPEYDEADWQLVHTEYHPADDKHSWPFSFNTYLRCNH